MKLISLDPRVGRMDVPEENVNVVVNNQDDWQTWEVFHQKKRGLQHQHAGIVHAPNSDMALVLAKEQFTRRGATANIWVVRSADVVAATYDDADIFETTPEKIYRDAAGYK